MRYKERNNTDKECIVYRTGTALLKIKKQN